MIGTRLAVQLYLALLAAIFLCLLAVALAFHVFGEAPLPAERLHAAAALFVESLPPVDDPEFPPRLHALADELVVDAAVVDRTGRWVASAVRAKGPLPPPPRRLGLHHDLNGPSLVVPLDAEHRLVLHTQRPSHRPHPFTMTLLVLAVVIGAGSYPVARRLARRLERLQDGVARWGRGELSHRLAVEGRDEVAALAASFNRAAERIDALVTQQRQMLASASHELRSPLARIEMALELLAEADDPARRRTLVERSRQDIVDLDALIEQLLLFARTEAQAARKSEAVALAALVREEAERAQVPAETEEVGITGDPFLLRHLVRNLLENAQHHGGGQGVRATLSRTREGALIAVEDRGPGVPEAERDRIFAPFYRLPGAPTGEGWGLGLALVRQVARQHGGDARVVDREGGGSRFEVLLPAAPA